MSQHLTADAAGFHEVTIINSTELADHLRRLHSVAPSEPDGGSATNPTPDTAIVDPLSDDEVLQLLSDAIAARPGAHTGTRLPAIVRAQHAVPRRRLNSAVAALIWARLLIDAHGHPVT